MPKSQKRKKNSGVGVDFRRVKHKVGKKLPKAQNETDTTVRSGKIVLAEQSVAADKTGQATTQRKNTLHVRGWEVLRRVLYRFFDDGNLIDMVM